MFLPPPRPACHRLRLLDDPPGAPVLPMAATFRAVNTSHAGEPPAADTKEDIMSPSPATPRPTTAPQLPLDTPASPARSPDDATTPTRASFTSPAVAGQKPLPSSPFPQAVQVPEYADPDRPPRDNSQHSAKSSRRDSVDVDMDESDGEEGSDDESVNADGTRSGKKKKSQRFYCTDYPPCNLSFTRSEHLARHIRYGPPRAMQAFPLVASSLLTVV